MNKLFTPLIKNKKGMSIDDLQRVGIVFIVFAVSMGLGATVLADIQSSQTANSFASNITGYGLSGLNTLAKWLPTIGLVVVIAVIIGIIMIYLARQYG